jgi:hypothetical protein
MTRRARPFLASFLSDPPGGTDDGHLSVLELHSVAARRSSPRSRLTVGINQRMEMTDSTFGEHCTIESVSLPLSDLRRRL